MHVVRDHGISTRELALYVTLVLGQSFAWIFVVGWIEAGSGAARAEEWYGQFALGIIAVPAVLSLVLRIWFRGGDDPAVLRPPL